MAIRETARRRSRRPNYRPFALALLILMLALSLAFFAGYAVGGSAATSPEPPAAILEPPAASTAAPTSTPSPTPTATPTATPEAVVEEETVRHRDDIVADGNLLSYELQEVMQDYCEEYNVPYALALAIAEVETHFNPDAVSSTKDYGLMQINKGNHGWLLDLGIDPLTHDGNIHAGIYMISQHLQKYGEPELALMAYNNGPSGARKLWDAGTYQTRYTRKVMAAYEHWTSVLED